MVYGTGLVSWTIHRSTRLEQGTLARRNCLGPSLESRPIKGPGFEAIWGPARGPSPAQTDLASIPGRTEVEALWLTRTMYHTIYMYFPNWTSSINWTSSRVQKECSPNSNPLHWKSNQNWALNYLCESTLCYNDLCHGYKCVKKSYSPFWCCIIYMVSKGLSTRHDINTYM